MTERPVNTDAVADATLAFVNSIETASHHWPRENADVSLPGDWKTTLLLHFSSLEVELNPRRLPIDDNQRVGDLLRWAMDSQESLDSPLKHCRELRAKGEKWCTVYSVVNAELGTDYEYSADGSLQKMLRNTN